MERRKSSSGQEETKGKADIRVWRSQAVVRWQYLCVTLSKTGIVGVG